MVSSLCVMNHLRQCYMTDKVLLTLLGSSQITDNDPEVSQWQSR